VENYFNYFTEIEEQFQKRRGGILLLSTLDWALIETWKDAGIPLQAVLQGIDAAFERHAKRPTKSRKVNALAYCAQEVLAAAEDMKEAAIGASRETSARDSGFQSEEIAAFLRRNADRLDSAKLQAVPGVSGQALAQQIAASLRQMASELDSALVRPRLEEVERRLTVLEEKLLAVLMASALDEDLVAIRAQADRELAPYRRKMTGAQIGQLQKQYIHKKLLERNGLPRLSLFYM
jgi:DNA-binding transcriptional MerR regulator